MDGVDVQQQRQDRLKMEIETVAEQLQAVSTSDHARLAERIFVGVFLPFFAGDEKPAYPVTIGHWINVAGSPFASVDVVDAQQQRLFTVPPVFDRSAVQPIQSRGTSIQHVVLSAEQLSRMHPTQGANYLSAELTRRALVMKVPTSVLAHLETWNAIFTRYGRPPIAAVDDKPATAAPGAASDDDYDLEPL